jgi:hypothetical protein
MMTAKGGWLEMLNCVGCGLRTVPCKEVSSARLLLVLPYSSLFDTELALEPLSQTTISPAILALEIDTEGFSTILKTSLAKLKSDLSEFGFIY